MKKNYIKPQGIITSLRPEERFAGSSFSTEDSKKLAEDTFGKILSAIGLGDGIKGF